MIKKTIKHIAFLGPKGSYSHIAALVYASYHLNHIIECSCQKFSDIFKLLECHQAEYGILPIENSNSGLIDEVCDLLLNTQLILIADITIPIQHHILVNKDTSLKQIQTIYSHSQPIQQCSKFLKKFSQWKIILCESSAFAIKTVAHSNASHLAALGSIQGGTCYGLKPLLLPQKTISNHHPNTTRFIILKNTNLLIINSSIKSKKIMLVVSISQKTEHLCLILSILQFYNIKINFLRLRTLLNNTSKKIIILEITAYFNDNYTQKALTEIQKNSFSFKILGYYSSILSKNNNLFNQY